MSPSFLTGQVLGWQKKHWGKVNSHLSKAPKVGAMQAVYQSQLSPGLPAFCHGFWVKKGWGPSPGWFSELAPGQSGREARGSAHNSHASVAPQVQVERGWRAQAQCPSAPSCHLDPTRLGGEEPFLLKKTQFLLGMETCLPGQGAGVRPLSTMLRMSVKVGQKGAKHL